MVEGSGTHQDNGILLVEQVVTQPFTSCRHSATGGTAVEGVEGAREVQAEGTLQPAHRCFPQRRELAEDGDEREKRDACHSEYNLFQQVHADMTVSKGDHAKHSHLNEVQAGGNGGLASMAIGQYMVEIDGRRRDGIIYYSYFLAFGGEMFLFSVFCCSCLTNGTFIIENAVSQLLSGIEGQ